MHYNRANFNPDPVSDLIYQGIAPKVFDSDFANAAQGNLTYHGTTTASAVDFISASMASKRTTLPRSSRSRVARH